jgi:hypothetical protein
MTDDKTDKMYDPRVTLHNIETGEATPVEANLVQGLDEFSEAWESQVETPSPLTFEGWQMSDDEHPPGSGRPGYRIVYKTLRTIVVPPVRLEMPNLLVKFTNGEVTIGSPIFHGTLDSRKSGHFMVPEWGSITLGANGNGVRYEYDVNRNVHVQAAQDTYPPCNYVEVLYVLNDGVSSTYETSMSAGRAGIAPFTAMLDLAYGDRLLGPILTEEVGELFEDWHWNRRLGGRTVALESQANMKTISGHLLSDGLRAAVDRQLELSDESRASARVASQWYWEAENQSDLGLGFASYWLVLEALELGQNANIRPLRVAFSAMLGCKQDDLKESIGRLYGERSGLLHGNVRAVDKNAVTKVRALASALLHKHLFGHVPEERVEEVRQVLLP